MQETDTCPRIVLGIETSCDETAAAIVEEGRRVRSSVVFSQAHLHGPYGGVVPEIASRSHVARIGGIVAGAVRESGLGWGDLDAVAATYGPGLPSSLLVGLSAGKALALRLGVPFRAMDHIEAHLYSPFLGDAAPRFEDACPFIALVVSGGHTSLFRVEGLGRYRLLGQTVDDAAGEAFDKGANLLHLGYPGGPAMEKASAGGAADTVAFPRGRQRRGRGPEGLDEALCFSFSGLKTSLLYHLRDHGEPRDRRERADIAAAYQEAIVDSLVSGCERALTGEKALAVGGGVSLNGRLRERLGEMTARRGVRLLLADRRYCADNAAMIAGLAGMGRGVRGKAALEVEMEPNLTLV